MFSNLLHFTITRALRIMCMCAKPKHGATNMSKMHHKFYYNWEEITKEPYTPILTAWFFFPLHVWYLWVSTTQLRSGQQHMQKLFKDFQEHLWTHNTDYLTAQYPFFPFSVLFNFWFLFMSVSSVRQTGLAPSISHIRVLKSKSFTPGIVARAQVFKYSIYTASLLNK